MNPFTAKLDIIFTKYLAYKSDWKYVVIDINAIMREAPEIFSDNARVGFRYLYIVIANTICDNCDDAKAFRWLTSFATAWINRLALPEYSRDCWEGVCKG